MADKRAFDPKIKDYYDRAPEETRLQNGPFQLEEVRTRELILRHAPKPPACVLDVGGAAGVYAFWLAERGYEVRLIDATPRLVDVARKRNESADHPLASCAVGDARALTDPDNSADIVLMLGPLYHLTEASDRRDALSEAWRVLRNNGVLIAAGISRYASALDGLSRELFRDRNFMPIVERDLADGNHQNPTGHLDYFTTSYLHRPEDLRDEASSAGFGVEGLYGIEGPGWILSDFGERWNDPERRDMILDVARKLETQPSMLGASAHLLVVGRKTLSPGRDT
ncbi:MAG TPA: methyltransferase domain-containing protein [Gemmatimonadaceae bacterium]|nr:methyltransferase domain-containing protein [Gemmatimonadaceae bacterium]